MVTLAASTYLGGFRVSKTTQVQADHGYLAISRSGFVCMPFNHAATNKNISCRIGFIDSVTDTFSPITDSIPVALSGTSIYAGGETCEKPWVCALTDDSFVVTWERQGTAVTNARIECARVYRSGQDWLVESASSGIGYSLDSTVTDGDGDCNCRSLWVRDNIFFISYGTETANADPDPGTEPHERTYTIRTGLLDWSTTGQAPVSLATKAYANQHWDDLNDTASGGFMLTTSMVTRRGDILVMWENRDVSAGPTWTSTIETRILSGYYAETQLDEIQTSSAIVTAVTDVNNALRRPCVRGLHPLRYPTATTTSGSSTAVLVYGLENISTPGSSAAKLGVVSMYGGATISNAAKTWTANAGLNATADTLGSACPVAGENITAGIAIANYDTNAGRYISIQHTNETDHETFHSRFVAWLDRPFAECWKVGAKEYLVLYYEGNDTGTASETQKFAECWRLE